MNIIEHKFVDVPHFLHLVDSYPNTTWIYRGQADKDYHLVPKAGREAYFHPTWEAKRDRERGIPPYDLGRFKFWREQAIAFSQNIPENDFECLAYAQHYGLATRLLDWTNNPLVALYFAAEKNHDIDGAVYCYLAWMIIRPEHCRLDDQSTPVARYTPRPFDQRVVAQHAEFTVHARPEMPLEPNPPHPEATRVAPDGVDLVRFIVEARGKPIILRQLDRIGINRRYLFPDLDGLSEFINWETRNDVQWVRRPDARPEDGTDGSCG